MYDDTSLRVFYAGSLGVYGSGGVCSRWYFKFNGAECKNPVSIEGVAYVVSNLVFPIRHRHIEGYCDKIPKGNINVEFWIGKCKIRNIGHGVSGSEEVSRIFIEEVPSPDE